MQKIATPGNTTAGVISAMATNWVINCAVTFTIMNEFTYRIMYNRCHTKPPKLSCKLSVDSLDVLSAASDDSGDRRLVQPPKGCAKDRVDQESVDLLCCAKDTEDISRAGYKECNSGGEDEKYEEGHITMEKTSATVSTVKRGTLTRLH